MGERSAFDGRRRLVDVVGRGPDGQAATPVAGQRVGRSVPGAGLLRLDSALSRLADRRHR